MRSNTRAAESCPCKFLKTLLPDPGSLGEHYLGKTCIGCVIEGVRGGSPSRQFIYNICDHASCYRELGAQAVSFTTGMLAMIGAKMVLDGTWRDAGVCNMEQFDSDPFMDALDTYGLPWNIKSWTNLI